MAKRKTVADSADRDETKTESGRDLTDGELIARRTIDTDEASLDEHIKVFVIPDGPKPTESAFDHEPNKVATRQYAISQGLRPTGPVTLKKVARHRNGKSWEITYSVPVTPVERGLDASGPDIVTDQSAEASAADVKTDAKTTD